MAKTVSTDPKTQPAYEFDPATKAYVGQSIAYESPLEPGVFHLPANSTLTAPPAAAAGQVAAWDGSAWNLVPDYRGAVLYSTATGEKAGIGTVGELPEAVTTLAPATPNDKWTGAAWSSPGTAFDTWNGKAWVTDKGALAASLMADLRRRRNGLLLDSDWTQVTDSPLPVKKREAWQAYRQSLRDLPANTKDPAKVAWPTQPN